MDNGSIRNIGSIIASLRREKGVKQEELGSAVGVSAQAVSKWECGGVPDTELLPAIADYFEVTLDALFGRDSLSAANVEDTIVKYLGDFPSEQRIKEAWKLCWAVEIGVSGDYTKNIFGIEDYLKSYPLEKAVGQRSQIIKCESGITNYSLDPDNPFFMLAPSIDGGFKRLTSNDIDYSTFFRELGDEINFKALPFLYGRTEQKKFTRRLFVNELSMSDEESGRALEFLKKYGFIFEDSIELDGEEMKIYSCSVLNPALIFLLVSALDMIKKPTHFQLYYGNFPNNSL